MTQCNSVTNKGIRCKKNAFPNSMYCENHDKKVLTRNELKEELQCFEKRSNKSAFLYFVLGVIVGFFSSLYFYDSGIKQSIELSEKSFNDTLKLTEASLNKTFWMRSPVILQVDDRVNETEGLWYINVTNTHPLRDTGRIYLYRIEINPDRPFTINETGLKPGESKPYTLAIKTKEVIYNNQTTKHDRFSWTIPFRKIPYVNEHISITVRITCDTCASQGIILREPEYHPIQGTFLVTNKGFQGNIIDIYEWVDYKLEDILENSTI